MLTVGAYCEGLSRNQENEAEAEAHLEEIFGRLWSLTNISDEIMDSIRMVYLLKSLVLALAALYQSCGCAVCNRDVR